MSFDGRYKGKCNGAWKFQTQVGRYRLHNILLRQHKLMRDVNRVLQHAQRAACYRRSILPSTTSLSSSVRYTGRFYSTAAGSLASQFEESVSTSKRLKGDPGNDAKLKLYALYKQATEGVNATKKPGVMDIVGKYKWQAWSQLGDMDQDEAMKLYVDEVNRLKGEIGVQE